MHDLKLLLENPEYYREKLLLRKYDLDINWFIKLDKLNRELKTSIQHIQTTKNDLSDEFGKLKKAKSDTSEIVAKSKKVDSALVDYKRQQVRTEKSLFDELQKIPNIALDSVPKGIDESGNIEFRANNTGIIPIDDPKNHYDLLQKYMDFEAGVKIAGTRFTVLRGPLATLERAIGQFMLFNNIGYGFTEINTPSITNADSLVGTGQLPKFEEDLFKLNNGMYLIPTAEVTLTNLHRNEIIKDFGESIRYTGLTSCYRSEAGGAGKDTRGMIRQHQFNKAELVSICTEDQWEREFDLMLACATNILDKLEIKYRVIRLCTGDMGFSARQTYDIEVWLPGQKCFREISSISYCGDFQARRMNMKYNKDKKNIFLHTLNGSSLAVGRTLVAIMENYQTSDNSVMVPAVLQKYCEFDMIYNG